MMQPQSIIAQQFPKVVIPLIETAQKSIHIIIYDWRWYPSVGGSTISQFNAAIVAAIARGVEVKALVSNAAVMDHLRRVGGKARMIQSKKMLHTKLMILDDVMIVIGSHNYTHHGFTMNEEASVCVEMPTQDNDFVKYFNALYGI